jgi:dipeptidyl-peptidase-4
MHLVTPDAKARDKTAQQEIWVIAPSSEDHSGPTAPEKSPEPALLLSSAQVTSSLRGTSPALAPKLDDDDEFNPYLLKDFLWTPDNTSIVLIGQTSVAIFDLSTKTAQILISGEKPLSDAAISPDGRTISFIRDHKLLLESVSGGAARTFAAPPQSGIYAGEPDWPYRNEFHLQRAYWWSLDSSRIAYLETDDRAVAKYAIRSSDGSSREIVYPRPGQELPIIHVYVKNLKSASPVKIDLGITNNSYVPRVAWLPDGRHLAIERLDRHQQNLELLLADTVTGKTTPLLQEKDKYWINVSDDLYFFKDGSRFLWSSERDGFRHLYLYNLKGQQLAQLTRGDWEVTSLNAVNESAGKVYFSATEKSPLERHLYQIDLDGSHLARITQQPGTHQVLFAPQSDLSSAGATSFDFVDTFSSTTSAPETTLRHISAMPVTTADKQVPEPPPTPLKKEETLPTLQPVEFLTLKLHLGAEAHAFFIRPPAFDASKKYPVIVYLAGGPGEQLVKDAWGGPNGLWMQFMAQKGYLIFALDNQATAGRGHYFEEPIHLRLGAQEMTDQRDGISYLKSLPYVDSARIGVCGWGYGGFLAVHAMLDRPVSFKAGFGGAPVTDWRFYDAIFSERYLDDPIAHADGWDASTSLENARYLQSPLLLSIGTGDEFVHLENVLTLQDRLLDAGKSADLLLFPDRGHEIEDAPARIVLFSRLTDFFLKNL